MHEIWEAIRKHPYVAQLSATSILALVIGYFVGEFIVDPLRDFFFSVVGAELGITDVTTLAHVVTALILLIVAFVIIWVAFKIGGVASNGKAASLGASSRTEAIRPTPISYFSSRAPGGARLPAGIEVGKVHVLWNNESRSATAVSEADDIVVSTGPERSPYMLAISEPLIIDCLFKNVDGPFAWSILSSEGPPFGFSGVDYEEVSNTRKQVVLRVKTSQICATSLKSQRFTVSFHTR